MYLLKPACAFNVQSNKILAEAIFDVQFDIITVHNIFQS